MISTFHALGLRFLQIEHAAAGLRRGFSIFDADDSNAQIKDLMPGAKPDAVELAKNLISRAKNAGLSPEEALARQVKFDRLPQHVAVIMDGNGRWAAQQHLPRVEGHRAGIESVRDVVES